MANCVGSAGRSIRGSQRQAFHRPGPSAGPARTLWRTVGEVERRGGALPAPEGLRKRAETLLGEVPVKGEHVVQLQLSHERKTRAVDEAELAALGRKE
jgi:hypothetical protein